MATEVRRSRLALVALMLPMLVSCRAGMESSDQASRSPASESAVVSASSIPIDPTPSPTPILPVLPGWSIIEILVDGSVQSVAQGANGWVAVGRSGKFDEPPVWFSEDGATWVVAASTPEMSFEPILSDVIAGGPGYVAAGTDFLIDGGPPFIWTSPDGLHWTAASFGDGVTLGHVHGLAELANRFFAGGSLVGSGGFGTGPAVMWSSATAMDWTQSILESGSAIGTYATTPLSIAGTSVSVGGAYRPYTGLVWTTDDNTRWSLAQTPSLEGALLEEAVVVGAQLVAVGETYEQQDNPEAVPTIWVSEDARSWEVAYAGLCCRRIEHVAAVGDGGLAIAADVVYLSGDGVTWRLGGAIGGFNGQLVDLVVTPSLGVVAVGNDGDKNYLLVPPAT